MTLPNSNQMRAAGAWGGVTPGKCRCAIAVLPVNLPPMTTAHPGRFTQRRPVRPLLCIVAAALFLAAAVTGRAASKEPLWRGPGVEYSCDLNPRLPLAVHVVKIDRSQKDLQLHTTLGGDRQIGLAVLSDQVSFTRRAGFEPLAAINGDYFFMEPPFAGDPMNLQILPGGELVSAPGLDRAFFYLDAKGQPFLTNAAARFEIKLPDGKTIPFGLNETPETASRAVLFTRAAGPTTRMRGLEFVLERSGNGAWLPLQIGQNLTARVKSVNKDGYSKTSPDELVLSLDARAASHYSALTQGVVLTVSTVTTPDLAGATLALGGGPTLVRGGKARTDREFPGFDLRNPRTAMGWNDKFFYFVQADGRQPRHSMGMTLGELADYFVQLKCDYALNLDGGGSCTTWVNGKIVNNPSQRGMERPSGNAIVVVRARDKGR
jgi:hypothetical protein